MKKLLAFMMLTLALFVLAACGGGTATAPDVPQQDIDEYADSAETNEADDLSPVLVGRPETQDEALTEPDEDWVAYTVANFWIEIDGVRFHFYDPVSSLLEIFAPRREPNPIEPGRVSRSIILEHVDRTGALDNRRIEIRVSNETDETITFEDGVIVGFEFNVNDSRDLVIETSLGLDFQAGRDDEARLTRADIEEIFGEPVHVREASSWHTLDYGPRFSVGAPRIEFEVHPNEPYFIRGFTIFAGEDR